MRTLRTELRWALAALTLLTSLLMAQRLRAEERDSSAREKALKLNTVTGMDPLRGEVLTLLDDKTATRKLVAEAARMAKDKPQPFTYNATLILAMAANQVKDYPAAETFYRLHRDQAKQLGSVKGVIIAYSGLISALFEAKKYAAAEKVCKEAIDHELIQGTLLRLERETGREAEEERKPVERFRTLVIEEMILSIAQQGEDDRANDTIDRIFKSQPNNWLSLDLKARVYRIVGKSKEAVKTYEDELDRIKNDKDLKDESKESLIDDIRYSLSGVYVETNQIDKAAEQLKALLKKDPDNPTYNNDLGYIWADHDMNLTESEKLIRKAMEDDRKQRRKANPKDDKDNGAYLDSLGWVLFKQKKYDEAKKYLQKAVELEEGKHIEIFDHLGEVLMALGKKPEAVAAWKKGVESASETKREQKRKDEVQKKIKANE
jgi:tetratricopeptide (TPR) repeat protein